VGNYPGAGWLRYRDLQLNRRGAVWPIFAMRMILVASFITLAACSGEASAPPPAPVAAQGAQVETNPAAAVIEAERAFAAQGATTGWIDAYPIWADANAVVLQGG